MRRIGMIVVLALCTLLFASISSAQQTSTIATTTSISVPNLIRYSGTLKDAQGAALASTTPVGVTFAFYNQQDGGGAIWQETQNVTADANGQYSVLLGSTTAAGLPGDLFSQQEQRWLGVQVQGQEEQARVLLVSVPYAFKAHEADTLGGLPSSAFVQTAPSNASVIGSGTAGTAVNALADARSAGGASNGKGAAGSAKAPCSSLAGGGTQFYLAYWSNNTGCALGNSVIYQSPVSATLNYIGINNPAPAAQLDVSGSINSSAGYEIGGNDVLVSNPTLLNLIVGGGPGSINSGEYNTFSGIQAGFTNNTGHANTFSGAQAGYANTQGQGNTFTGTQTGARNITGSFNSFFGVSAGLNSNADYNTFVGEDTGFLTTTGSNNTFLGAEAGNSNIGGSANTFSGSRAGFNNTGPNNSFYGFQAGYNNTANGNSFYGREAGFSNTTQSGNAFFGYQAGYSSTIDANNVFGHQSGNTYIGYQAGYSDTTDLGNSFFGYQAGFNTNPALTGGHVSANTFFGYQAGYSNISGTSNAYFGYNAGYHNTTDGNNAFFGVSAGEGFSGNVNTFIGYWAGVGSGTGDFNIFVGGYAGEYGSGDDNIYLGNQGTSEANTIRIGDPNPNDLSYQTAAYVAGIYNSSPGMMPNYVVCVDVNGKLWGTAGYTCTPSSRRFKEQILDMGDSSSKLFQLRPVSFFYKPQYDDGSHLQQYGLIAEEVAKVYPEMAVYDKDGQPYSVKYQLLAPMLLNELQKQHAVVAGQQDVITTQQEQIQTQGQQITDLQARLSRLESLIANK